MTAAVKLTHTHTHTHTHTQPPWKWRALPLGRTAGAGRGKKAGGPGCRCRPQTTLLPCDSGLLPCASGLLRGVLLLAQESCSHRSPVAQESCRTGACARGLRSRARCARFGNRTRVTRITTLHNDQPVTGAPVFFNLAQDLPLWTRPGSHLPLLLLRFPATPSPCPAPVPSLARGPAQPARLHRPRGFAFGGAG